MRPGGDRPDQVSFYFRREWRPLVLVMVTGSLFNVGLVTGPLFEGRLAQCLLEVLRGETAWPAMAKLAVLYAVVTAEGLDLDYYGSMLIHFIVEP